MVSIQERFLIKSGLCTVYHHIRILSWNSTKLATLVTLLYSRHIFLLIDALLKKILLAKCCCLQILHNSSATKLDQFCSWEFIDPSRIKFQYLLGFWGSKVFSSKILYVVAVFITVYYDKIIGTWTKIWILLKRDKFKSHLFLSVPVHKILLINIRQEDEC